MIIKKLSNFINENLDNHLLYYAFDWDDNILKMPTVIHMEKKEGDDWVPVDVSTSEFAEVRNDENYRILNNSVSDAFSEFRDYGPRKDMSFTMDAKKAIELGNYGPVWDDFIECLTNGSLFAIITARGHESPTIRKGVEWIIDNILTEEELQLMYSNLIKFHYLFSGDDDFDRILKGKPSENRLVKEYLDNCLFIGVSAPSMGASAQNPEEAKVKALLSFKRKVNDLAGKIGKKATIGFSDDDLKNVKHIEDLVDNINHEEFPNIIKYVVKGTKDPESMTKKVRSISENQAPGLQSSIMPFTQFNNMSNRMFTDPKEYDKEMEKGTEQLAKMSKEYINPISKKRKKKKN